MLLCAVAAVTVVVHEELESPLLDGRALHLHDLAQAPCSPSVASARSVSDWHGSAGGRSGDVYDQVCSEFSGCLQHHPEACIPMGLLACANQETCVLRSFDTEKALLAT